MYNLYNMSNSKITIIDYGVGNLHSLKRAFEHFEILPRISEDAEVISGSDAVILPGVGSFEAGMRGLKVRGLVETVKNFANSGKPVLGICLGAQLMLSEGHEFGVFEGLNLMPGKVIRFSGFQEPEKIPQVGWNGVYAPQGVSWTGSPFEGLDQKESDVYFVHSYILSPEKRENIFGLTKYGGLEFCSIIKKGNIYGCQFHPEKSSKGGLEIIKNFVKLAS